MNQNLYAPGITDPTLAKLTDADWGRCLMLTPDPEPKQYRNLGTVLVDVVREARRTERLINS